MGRFFVRGVDPAGRKRTERVSAESAAEALAQLGGAGWRDLELLSDAIFATLGTPAAEAQRPQVEATFDPNEELSFSRFGTRWQVWMLIKKGGWVLVALALWLLWRRATGRVFDGWEPTLWLSLFGMLAVAAYMLWSTGRYKRLVRASAAGRWEETLRRAESLQRSSIGKLIVPSELAFRRAGALLGLGREAEALAVLANADRNGTPEWAFEARLGDFHARRKRLDEALACFQRCVELGGQHAESHLSLAEFLAGYQMRDPVGARAALAQARSLPLAATVQWAVERIEAMIAIEEGRFDEALGHLQRSRSALLRMADGGLHALQFAGYAAYAAIALGGLGRREEARTALAAARAEQWLRPHVPDLLSRAQAAAG
jgi:tetratricopeptide (TPR) repeat protein